LKVVLSHNGLGETGGIPIAQFLGKNNNVLMLGIAHCRLGDGALGMICKALDSTYTLRELDISYNQFSDNGLLQILKAILSNNSLKKVNIAGMKMTMFTRAALKDVKDEKNGLIIVE
jgi:Ran GTPase-activating protein (RanGAP) involved in mRNA processing and transport